MGNRCELCSHTRCSCHSARSRRSTDPSWLCVWRSWATKGARQAWTAGSKALHEEYLEASSPRREQIKEHLREQGIDGAAAAQIAAHHTRDRKELLSPEEVLQRHRELAALYGHQADRVVAQARARGEYQMLEPEMQAQQAVTWARDHVFREIGCARPTHNSRSVLWRIHTVFTLL